MSSTKLSRAIGALENLQARWARKQKNLLNCKGIPRREKIKAKLIELDKEIEIADKNFKDLLAQAGDK